MLLTNTQNPGILEYVLSAVVLDHVQISPYFRLIPSRSTTTWLNPLGLIRWCFLIQFRGAVAVAADPVTALQMLGEGKHKFDLVICDVRVSQKDGIKLLKVVGLKMDLPVIGKASLFSILQSSIFVHGMAFPVVL